MAISLLRCREYRKRLCHRCGVPAGLLRTQLTFRRICLCGSCFAYSSFGDNNSRIGTDKLRKALRLIKVNFLLCHLVYIIKAIIMELYNLANLLLDISIGVSVLGVIIRLILTYRYFKINGSKTLNDSQKNTIKKVRYPIAIIALLAGIAALILFFV